MRVVLVCCVLAGCYNPTAHEGAPCSTNRDCPGDLECNAENKCVKDAVMNDGGPDIDACPDNACMGDVLVGCNTMVSCENGCGGATPHCLSLAPSNGLIPPLLLPGATADVTLDKLNFDSSDGSIRMMNVDIREAGTGVKSGIRFEVVNNVGVWVANTWTLAANNDWSFTGTRPITLFAAKSITIRSLIDVGANPAGAAGPGGTGRNPSTTTGGCRGRAGRNIDATHGEGGGGGGGGYPAMGAQGANGGSSNQGGALTGLGGGCASNPSTVPLLGGNGGGDGGNNAGNFGGGGGGAISLVAMESVTITGTVAAPGGGGGNLTAGNGGGGGGGGGAVFVEAPTVTISGQLTANGGGGGAPSGGANGTRGATASATAAAGGLYSGSGGPARGGAGGAGIVNPTNGASYNFDDTVNLTNTNRGGGGGGAAGRIEVKRRVGGVSGLASPPANITNAIFE